MKHFRLLTLVAVLMLPWFDLPKQPDWHRGAGSD